MKLDINLYLWAIKGSQRIITLKVMEGEQRPTDIMRLAKKINNKITLNTTSDTLRDFVKMNLSKCINENEKIGRIYTLTSQGEMIKNRIIKNKIGQSP